MTDQAIVGRPGQAIAQAGEFATEGHTLASALAVLGEQMQAAVNGMTPDDVIIEVDHSRDGTRSQTHLRFRAYRTTRGT